MKHCLQVKQSAEWGVIHARGGGGGGGGGGNNQHPSHVLTWTRLLQGEAGGKNRFIFAVLFCETHFCKGHAAID